MKSTFKLDMNTSTLTIEMSRNSIYTVFKYQK